MSLLAALRSRCHQHHRASQRREKWRRRRPSHPPTSHAGPPPRPLPHLQHWRSSSGPGAPATARSASLLSLYLARCPGATSPDGRRRGGVRQVFASWSHRASQVLLRLLCRQRRLIML